MHMAQFVFETSNVTEEFLELDALILQAAEDNPGYVGKENWLSEDGNRRNAVYYWQNEVALKEFASHPKHLEAKKRYQEWYSGFHVVIAEVSKSYGDSAFRHLTPNSRKR